MTITRTRCSPFDTLPRPRVRHAAVCIAFPLVDPLSSTDSAALSLTPSKHDPKQSGRREARPLGRRPHRRNGNVERFRSGCRKIARRASGKIFTGKGSPATGKRRFPRVLRIIGHLDVCCTRPTIPPDRHVRLQVVIHRQLTASGHWRSYLTEALVKRDFLESSAAVTLQATTSYKRLNC